MTGVELLDQRRHPLHDGFGTGHPNDASVVVRRACYLALEVTDHSFNALGKGPQLLAKISQTIARSRACDELASQALFQFREPPLHGRLTGPECLCRCDRTAIPSDRDEVFEVVPIE